MGFMDFIFGKPDKVKEDPLTTAQSQLNAAITEETGRYGDYLGRIKSLYDFTPQEQRMVGEQATKVMGQQGAAQRAQLGSLLAKRPGGLQGAVNYLMAQQAGQQRAGGDALGRLYANLAMQRKQMQQQGLSQEMAAGQRRVQLLSGMQSPTKYIEKGTSGIIAPVLTGIGTVAGAVLGGPAGAMIGSQLGSSLGSGLSRGGGGDASTGGGMNANWASLPTSWSSGQKTAAQDVAQTGEDYFGSALQFTGRYAKGGAINRGSAGLMGEAGRETVVTGHGKFTVDRPTLFMSMAKGNIIPSQQGQHGIKGKHAGRAGAAAAAGMNMGMGMNKGRRSQGHNGWKGQLKRRGA